VCEFSWHTALKSGFIHNLDGHILECVLIGGVVRVRDSDIQRFRFVGPLVVSNSMGYLNAANKSPVRGPLRHFRMPDDGGVIGSADHKKASIVGWEISAIEEEKIPRISLVQRELEFMHF